jgi:hypothetical protein
VSAADEAGRWIREHGLYVYTGAEHEASLADLLAAAERRGAEGALREAAAEIDRMMVADRSSIRRQAFGRAATLVAEMGRGARSGRGR